MMVRELKASLVFLGGCCLVYAVATVEDLEFGKKTSGSSLESHLVERVKLLEARDRQQQQQLQERDFFIKELKARDSQQQLEIDTLKSELRMHNQRIILVERLLSQISGTSVDQPEVVKTGDTQPEINVDIQQQEDEKNPGNEYSNPARRARRETHKQQKAQRMTQLPNSLGLTPAVAFFATLTKAAVHLGPKQVIAFDNVVTNFGKAYNNNTGTFTVPISGVYVIAMTLTSALSNSEYYALLHNDETVINLNLRTTQYPHTVVGHTAVLHMNAGSLVRIENQGNDGNVYGGRFSTLSGFLLYADQDNLPVLG